MSWSANRSSSPGVVEPHLTICRSFPGLAKTPSKCSLNSQELPSPGTSISRLAPISMPLSKIALVPKHSLPLLLSLLDLILAASTRPSTTTGLALAPQLAVLPPQERPVTVLRRQPLARPLAQVALPLAQLPPVHLPAPLPAALQASLVAQPSALPCPPSVLPASLGL
jgi:hypothetical protein